MAKRVDPLKAKKAKQKKLAIGLCVLLAGVVAFQGPKMLKMMKGPQAAAVAEPAAPVATPTPTAAVPGAPSPRRRLAAPAVPAQEAVLADSDVAPDAESGQLVSIESFSTKDPFAQQLTETEPSDNAAPAAADAPAGATPTVRHPDASGAASGHLRPARLEPAGSGPERAPGEHHSVGRPARHGGGDHDLDQRIDRERRRARARSRPTTPSSSSSRSQRTASPSQISVAGGSYSDGKQTIKLQIGKKLTLQNTSDGSRYELELLTVAGFVPPKK